MTGKTALAAALIAMASTVLAEWTVVLEPGAWKEVREQAGVLAETFSQSTGEKTAVVAEKDWNGTGKAIFVGETAAAKAAGLSEAVLTELETYAVQGDGDRYVVNGRGPVGKVFAIYEFLSKVLDAEVLDAWTFDIRPADPAKLPKVSVCRRPDFRRRHITGPAWTGRYNLGAALKATGARLPNPQWGAPRACHSFYEYQKHWPKDRRDWLAKDENGEVRVLTGHIGPCFCLSNREAKDFFRKQLLDFIRADRVKFAKMGLPAPILYNVSQNDACGYFCKCPACAETVARRGDSALLLDFINELADAVKELYPDVLIETFAYEFTTEPPKDGTRPRDNVVIEACHTSGNYYAPVATDPTSRFVEPFKRWSKLAKHLAVWDYGTFFWDAFPSVYHNVDKIAQDLRFYRAHGTDYLWLEQNNSTTRSFYALTVFLQAKLADDLSQDENRLMDRFFAGFFGPAAEEMRAYYDLTVRLQQGKVGKIFIPASEFYKTPPRSWLDAAFFAETESLFARAEAKCAPGSRALFNVRHERVPIDLTILNTYERSGSKLPIGAVADRYETNATAYAQERVGKASLAMQLAAIRSEADCFRRAAEIADNKLHYRPELVVPRAPAQAKVTNWYDNNGFASDRRIVLASSVTADDTLTLSLADLDAGKSPMVVRDLNGLSDDFEVFLANDANEYVQVIVIPDGRHVVYVSEGGKRARPREVPAVSVSSSVAKDDGSWRVDFRFALKDLPVRHFTRANFIRSSTTCRFAWAPTYCKSFGVLERFGRFGLAASGADVSVDFGTRVGAMKPLHGVNNSPVRVGEKASQHEYRAAGIPFVRLHDTAGMWGGAHYVDIPNVFPDFAADENDPRSYDFAFTDAYLKPLVAAGCEIVYRLGVTIENHWKVKAYHIDPPKDFAKWARICEHVVRHYNEGWADGFRWNIRYWEIWNEPENPPMWTGTRDQFYELYRVTANHLKGNFPDIRVGGYGSCGFYAVDDAKLRAENAFYRSFVTWFEDFLAYVKDPATQAPFDFFSWHMYADGPEMHRIGNHANYVRKTLDAAGFTDVESIYDEWNSFPTIIEDVFGNRQWDWDAIKEPRGAADIAAAFCLMQNLPIDKAMYYDGLPTRAYCGLFYFPSQRTTPTFDAFRAYNVLYRLGGQVRATSSAGDLHVLAATDGSEKAILLANISGKETDVAPAVLGADGREFRLFRIDDAHRSLVDPGTWKAGERLTIPGYGVVLLTTKDPDPIVRPKAVKRNGNGIDDGTAAAKSLVTFESKGWKFENYQKALAVGIREGTLRIEGVKKVKDTAWSAKSAGCALPAGTKELSVSVRVASCKNLGVGGSMDNQKSTVFWRDASGKEIGSKVLSLPAPLGGVFVKVTDVVKVPEGAKSFVIRLGFDRPDFAPGEVVEYRDLTVLAHAQEGEVRPEMEKPDLRPVTVERTSASPFADASAAVEFRLSDPVGLVWPTLKVVVDGEDRTASCVRRDGRITVPAPAGGWTNGLHVAAFSVDSVRGLKARERRAFFRGETPKTSPVTLRDDGVLLVDGRPFFPIGAYNVIYDSRMPDVTIEKAYENLAAAGFNTAHTYENLYPQADRLKAMSRSGVRHWVQATVPDANFIGKGRNNPDFLAWYLGDDTSDNTSPETLRFYDSAVKAADPTRLTAQADSTFSGGLDAYGISRYSAYVTGTDIYMPEIYPIRGKADDASVTTCVATVIRDMRTIRRDWENCNDGKPRGCWPILQAFEGWGQWKHFPSADLIYATSMAAIVHGAMGIAWYTYCGWGENFGFATSPTRWEAMRFSTLRIRELAPVLLERTPSAQPSVAAVSGPKADIYGRPSVSCLLKRHGDETYLIAVNAAAASVRVRFGGLADCTEGEALWEGRRVLCADGCLDEIFGPQAVHVYRFPKSFPTPERGVLLLTFDDPNYDRWVRYIPLFEKYGAHVSFFPYGPLEGEALEKMASLRKAGHTVGTHTLEHVNLPDYLKSHGEEEFWDKQIEPHLRSYAKAGIRVMSFAYPNGRRTKETDEMLLRHGIRRIRGCGDGVHRVTFYDADGSRADEWKPIADNDYAFNPIEGLADTKVLFGATVGEAYHTDIDDLCAAIRRAARENKVLQLTSHDIAPDAKHINMKAEWLERILATAREEGVRMLGYDELPLK